MNDVAQGTNFQKEDSFSLSPCCLHVNDEESYEEKLT